MKRKHGGLIAIFAIALFFYGCTGQATEPGVTEVDILSPGQVDSYMVDQVVKVKGKVLMVTHNPGGLGGIYLRLGNGDGEIGVRIQPDVWETFDEKKKAQFKEGKTIIAEGILFQAGKTLVVIFGKFSPS